MLLTLHFWIEYWKVVSGEVSHDEKVCWQERDTLYAQSVVVAAPQSYPTVWHLSSGGEAACVKKCVRSNF